MKGEEIVENGLIAYCIIMFSEHTMLNIVIAEKLKELEEYDITNLPKREALKETRRSKLRWRRKK